MHFIIPKSNIGEIMDYKFSENLTSIANMAEMEKYKRIGFTEPKIRQFLFYRDHNGLADYGAIIQISPNRILIDTERFDAWIESKRITKNLKNGE